MKADWKLATAAAILKGGEQSTIVNYRPVSVTRKLCRRLEKLIGRHVCGDLTEHGFLIGEPCLSDRKIFLDEPTTELGERNVVRVFCRLGQTPIGSAQPGCSLDIRE